MEYSVQLDYSNENNQYLLAWMRDEMLVEYVVCSNYNPEKRFGSQWDWGHYFSRNELTEAIDYLHRNESEVAA